MNIHPSWHITVTKCTAGVGFFPNPKSQKWAPNYQHYKTKLKVFYTVPVGKYIHRQVIVCQYQMLKKIFFS